MANQKVYEGFVVGVCKIIGHDEIKVLMALDCDCGNSDEIQIIFNQDEAIEYCDMLMYMKPLRVTTYRGHRSWKVRKIEKIVPTDKMFGYGA
jgi:hypothetical protein